MVLNLIRHARGGGPPGIQGGAWIPVFTGMTTIGNKSLTASRTTDSLIRLCVVLILLLIIMPWNAQLRQF